MQITNVKCPESKYSIKCPYTMTPEAITVHNTANDASAMAEISYMIGNGYQTSFHAAVDDYRIVTGIPFNRNSWHASDGGKGYGNRKTISIEICYSKSGGERFTKAEKLAAEYIAYLLKQYGWGINKVTKHQDYAKKYCPHRTLDLGWQRFLKMIESYLGEEKKTVTGYVRYVKVSDWLNVRTGAGTSNSIVGKLYNGDKVTVYETKGTWSRIGEGKWVSSNYLVTTNPKSTIKNTVGQTKVLKTATTLYEKSNLTGTKWGYKANTSVIIKKNVSSTVDYIYVPKTNRYAYVKNNVYK